MMSDDGRQSYYVDAPGFYCEIEPNESGQYSVFFRDDKGREGFAESLAPAPQAVEAMGDDVAQRRLKGLMFEVWARSNPYPEVTPETMRKLLAQCLLYVRAAALTSHAAPAVAVELTDREHWLVLREGHLNAAAAQYFGARPQLDNAHNQRIFYAGHCAGYQAEPTWAEPTVREGAKL